jgi:hypothetical protein
MKWVPNEPDKIVRQLDLKYWKVNSLARQDLGAENYHNKMLKTSQMHKNEWFFYTINNCYLPKHLVIGNGWEYIVTTRKVCTQTESPQSQRGKLVHDAICNWTVTAACLRWALHLLSNGLAVNEKQAKYNCNMNWSGDLVSNYLQFKLIGLTFQKAKRRIKLGNQMTSHI